MLRSEAPAEPPEWMRSEQLYDGTGRHLGDRYPSLALNNVLMPAYYFAKSVRPVADSLCLRDEDHGTDLALVWMMPMQLPADVLLDRNVMAAMVQALDARRTVVVHGDNPDLVLRVGATARLFCGGGHA